MQKKRKYEYERNYCVLIINPCTKCGMATFKLNNFKREITPNWLVYMYVDLMATRQYLRLFHLRAGTLDQCLAI